MSALYQIAATYSDAAERMTDLGLPEDVIRDTLEGMAGELQEKATSVGQVIRNLESLAQQIEQAERQMRERRKALESRADWLRGYLLANMERTGITVIESPWFRLSVRANPPSVTVVDEAAIPEQFWKHPAPPPPVIDRKAIADAIKAGQDVPGARLDRNNRVEVK